MKKNGFVSLNYWGGVVFGLGLAVLLLPTGPAAAQVKQPAAAKTTVKVAPLISAIEITGNKLVSTADITSVIFSRVGENILAEKVKSDVKAIYALGYFADVKVSFEASGSGTKIVLTVDENPRIESLSFTGATVYKPEQLAKLLKNQPGKILNFNSLQEDIDALNSVYKKDGYSLARVVDAEMAQTSHVLNFKVVEGQVESIVLDGNTQTHDYVILRELYTKPGSVFNENVFKKDLRRVFNLGFFSEVSPNFEPGSAADKMVIQLKVKETRTSTINFGGGYGEREGGFGFIDLSINNLVGSGQSMMIRGQFGSQLSTYQFKYTNPWFWTRVMGDHAAMTFRKWYTIGRDVYLADQSGVYNGLDISIGKPFLENYNAVWTLGSELVYPYSTSTFEAYQSDTLGLTLSYDTRDFWMNPKEGRFYSTTFKQGWKRAASGNSTFFKVEADANNFAPVRDNIVFAIHLGGGIGFGDVPIGDKFWAGGANTVRGYNPSEIQVGKRKIIFNTEYRLTFSDLFQGVFFYDWGSAWDEGIPVFNNFLGGWGPGVRINTPLGPIRLDYGVSTKRSFSEGVMHFSIGQAF